MEHDLKYKSVSEVRIDSRRAQGLQSHHRRRGVAHADPRSRVGDGRLAAGASCMG
ncbi:MAG: hypothetical protein ACLSVD_15920 [Eggerthellaceae bacterium]